MNLKKKEYPLLKTESGKVEWAAGLFSLLFLGIMLCAVLQTDMYRSSSDYLEDALALSNLASAVIDVEEYGISHQLVISDPQQAYERYREAVKGNLNLDDSWQCPAGKLISGPVRIINYRVYNVTDYGVTVTSFDESGFMSRWNEALGSATAPGGIPIVSTSVYSEIAYQIDGFLGTSVEAHKGKLVDVVANE